MLKAIYNILVCFASVLASDAFVAIANLFNILSPEMFVIGGGVMVNLGAEYIKLVQKVADKYAYSTELAGIKIVQATLGDDSGVLGAAIAARERL